MTKIDRRSFFGLAGVAGLTAAVAIPSTLAASGRLDFQTGGSVIPFFNAHQPGITTEIQDRTYFLAMNVVASTARDLKDCLRELTKAAERMSRGFGAGKIGPVSGPLESPPDDTGEALDLPPARLTFTIGFGPSIFDSRFGLAGKMPAGFSELPRFAGDQIKPGRGGSDLIIQISADEDQVAFHAMRNLIRVSKGTLESAWIQAGFSGASRSQGSTHTPRNLFGFKDGTANLNVKNAAEASSYLWADNGWMTGGSFMALRNFRFDIETWDRSSLGEQQNVFGRDKAIGAPLSGGTEFSAPDFKTKGSDGQTAIDKNAHIALVHPSRHSGVKILRRAFNYANGVDNFGHLDAGLMFISFQKSLKEQFVPMQHAMASSDLLNEYITAIGSGAYACPPGLEQGQYWGHQLFN